MSEDYTTVEELDAEIAKEEEDDEPTPTEDDPEVEIEPVSSISIDVKPDVPKFVKAITPIKMTPAQRIAARNKARSKAKRDK